jgi:hypothetical protein
LDNPAQRAPIDQPVYTSLADLAPDPGSRGVLAASCLALAPLVGAVAMPCLGYLAPVVGALVLARASAHHGEARFAAFQMMVLGFALVVAMLLAQVVAALLGAQPTSARAVVSLAALGLLAWGLDSARRGRGPRLPLVSGWIFRAGFRGQPREG